MKFTHITTPTGMVTIDKTDGYMACYKTNSEAVSSWAFLPQHGALNVTWGDKTYIYMGVPFAIAVRLLATDSVGRFINKEVKPNYEVLKVAD